MEFDLPTTAAAFIAVIAIGVGGLLAAPMMTMDTVLMMVAPSMIVFGLLMLGIGVKYGEYRATGR
ncbi:DUF7333 family protein [Natrinema salifodinae]|uniref:Uncharacterized protein n=1 Tax=Natrinema salifodinae TaxID=1202768 RepID=A0A1I0MGR0_9EURY|nr:hypothetical protein [Natrinema salifodinae]SEV87555.1 hypothetical protein SAMN05216285_0952 [Natrinema salifodinae]